MKNLLILFSIMISINSFVGQLDSIDIHEIKLDSIILNQFKKFVLYNLQY